MLRTYFMFPIAVQPEKTMLLPGPAKSVLDNWLQPHSAMMEAHLDNNTFTTFLATPALLTGNLNEQGYPVAGR